MCERRSSTPLLVALAALAAGACGDDTAGDAGSGGGATAGTTTAASASASSASSVDGAVASGSGGGTSGSGGADATGGGGAGGAGNGGASDLDCTGDFVGAPEVMLELERNDTPSSIAVSRGERELHMVIYRGFADEGVFMRTVRASVDDPFPAPVVADDLEALCGPDEDRFLDVSEDGLRAYVTCPPIDPETDDTSCPDGGCEILLAERAGPVAPFELVGVVGHAGFHPSVRADELEIVTNGHAIAVGVAPLVARRGATDEDLDAAVEIELPLQGLQAVTGATISPDGLELYAFARPDDAEAGLSRFTRPTPGGAFGGREAIALWDVEVVNGVGAPDLTPDCRSIYVIRVGKDDNGIDRITRAGGSE
jgi:hypothetical protein